MSVNNRGEIQARAATINYYTWKEIEFDIFGSQDSRKL